MFENIDLYTDAILLMACLSAALFCLKLQAKLKTLQRSEKGMAQALQALADATETSRLASAEIKNQIADGLSQLDERAGRVHLRRQEIEDLLDSMEGQIAHQVRRCHEARQLTEKALTPLVHKAEVEIHALTRALELSSQMAGLSVSTETVLTEPEPSRVDPASVGRASTLRSNNPFLRAVGE